MANLGVPLFYRERKRMWLITIVNCRWDGFTVYHRQKKGGSFNRGVLDEVMAWGSRTRVHCNVPDQMQSSPVPHVQLSPAAACSPEDSFFLFVLFF